MYRRTADFPSNLCMVKYFMLKVLIGKKRKKHKTNEQKPVNLELFSFKT